MKVLELHIFGAAAQNTAQCGQKNHILFEFESFTVAPHAKLHLGHPSKLTLCEVQIAVEMQR